MAPSSSNALTIGSPLVWIAYRSGVLLSYNYNTSTCCHVVAYVRYQ